MPRRLLLVLCLALLLHDRGLAEADSYLRRNGRHVTGYTEHNFILKALRGDIAPDSAWTVFPAVPARNEYFACLCPLMAMSLKAQGRSAEAAVWMERTRRLAHPVYPRLDIIADLDAWRAQRKAAIPAR